MANNTLLCTAVILSVLSMFLPLSNPLPRPDRLHLKLHSVNSYFGKTYLNESDGIYPFIPLIVFHMRKSGGSNILGMLDYWYNVTSPQTFSGVQHCEYRCLKPLEIQRIPPRNSRKVNFTYLTSLRDPVGRIGSQAFFAITQSGLGLGTIKKFVAKARCSPEACPSSRADPSQCECHLRATQAALLHIRSNDELWYKWLNGSTVENGYIDNYFITRLTGGIPNKNRTQERIQNHNFNESLTCLQDPAYTGCRYVRGVFVNVTSIHGEIVRIRQGIGGSMSKGYRCNTSRSSPRADTTRANLQMAKALLKEIFDFVVIDKMEETCGRGALERALRAPKSIVNDMMRLHERPGFISKYAQLLNISGKYEDLMPPAILEHIRERNAEDIELYEYAQRLLISRSRIEQWEC